MDRHEWLAHARSIAKRHVQAPRGSNSGDGIRPKTERALLAEMHALVCAAPLQPIDEFRNLPEEALTSRAGPRINIL
jgi:hypothetical protein